MTFLAKTWQEERGRERWRGFCDTGKDTKGLKIVLLNSIAAEQDVNRHVTDCEFGKQQVWNLPHDMPRVYEYAIKWFFLNSESMQSVMSETLWIMQSNQNVGSRFIICNAEWSWVHTTEHIIYYRTSVMVPKKKNFHAHALQQNHAKRQGFFFFYKKYKFVHFRDLLYNEGT